MMVVPKGGFKQKLRFFQVTELESNKFVAVLKSFVRKPEDFDGIIEDVKECCEGTGEFLEVKHQERIMTFIVNDREKFMEHAMTKGLIFRKQE